MKSGKCPKCDSARVHCNSLRGPLSKGTSSQIQISAWDTDQIDNYVCVDCGYMESYLAGEKTLATIAATWPAVAKKSGG